MTLPTIPPRDPQAGRQAEAARLRSIVERPTVGGVWTTASPISFEQWQRHAAALVDAPRNRPFTIDGVTWHFEPSS